MELKKTFLVLSASCVLGALLMLGLVFMICNSISSNFPSGGIEILADGSIVKMEPPTETQQNIFSMLGIIQIVSCIVLPMGGLALSGILYYHIKLKQPISTLRNGISRIRNHDLDFSMPVHSDDELGQLCTAFDTMREELLKSNQELWRQAEERKRLNVAFSHDLRNPITVLKGRLMPNIVGFKVNPMRIKTNRIIRYEHKTTNQPTSNTAKVFFLLCNCIFSPP